MLKALLLNVAYFFILLANYICVDGFCTLGMLDFYSLDLSGVP
jgi:hypothetical protein